MNKKKVLGLSLLSGIMLGVSWYPPFTTLIFAAWIPILFATTEILKNSKRPKTSAFFYSYLTFLIWNTISTWWTWFASPGGSIAAILANSLLMSVAYWIFFILYKKLSTSNSKLATIGLLIPVWLSFEYLHSLWELAWTWLTLGNVLAFSHKWIQWYEFTGVSGGSLWILAVNILAFRLVSRRQEAVASRIRRTAIIFVSVMLLPILISFILIPSHQQINTSANQQIVIVQPNIDPYNEKFNGDFQSQVELVYKLSKDKITAKTNYLVLPETFITESIWENNLEESYTVKFFRDSLLKKYPGLVIVTGATTFYHFKHGEKLSATADKYSDADEYYDVFNTALQLDNFGAIQVYHKSKLVPGVERMPYPGVFGFLEKLAIDLGGTSGSLGTQEERGVLFNKDKSIGVAPVICYESVFGEYVGDYFEKGANLIFILTNDGWWSDSPGYVQHLNYARLRAIETRTPIARCANTGVSCFVNERGDLSQETPFWEPAVISGDLSPNNEKTFFVKYGDIISTAALTATVGLIVLSFFRRRPSRSL